jgi:hypothetical protein
MIVVWLVLLDAHMKSADIQEFDVCGIFHASIPWYMG